MKMGFRTPSVKRSISARTTGKMKRAVKSSINPLYGKKGMGYINNPKKAVYNKVYNKTTVGINQVFSSSSSTVDSITFDTKNALLRVKQLNETVSIINTTTNVDTFFSRFDFALDICEELKQYEYTGSLKNITPTQQKQELLDQIPNVINSLIIRCHDKEFAKAQELKTDKGKKNRIIRFFDNMSASLNLYGSKYISETNIAKLRELATTDGVINDVSINLKPTPIMPKITSENNVTVKIENPVRTNIPREYKYNSELDKLDKFDKNNEFDKYDTSSFKGTSCRIYATMSIIFGIVLFALGSHVLAIFLFILAAILIAKSIK